MKFKDTGHSAFRHMSSQADCHEERLWTQGELCSKEKGRDCTKLYILRSLGIESGKRLSIFLTSVSKVI